MWFLKNIASFTYCKTKTLWSFRLKLGAERMGWGSSRFSPLVPASAQTVSAKDHDTSMAWLHLSSSGPRRKGILPILHEFEGSCWFFRWQSEMFPFAGLRGLALRGREAHSTIVWPHPTLLCVVTQDAERFSLDVSKQERKLYLKATWPLPFPLVCLNIWKYAWFSTRMNLCIFKKCPWKAFISPKQKKCSLEHQQQIGPSLLGQEGAVCWSTCRRKRWLGQS